MLSEAAEIVRAVHVGRMTEHRHGDCSLTVGYNQVGLMILGRCLAPRDGLNGSGIAPTHRPHTSACRIVLLACSGASSLQEFFSQNGRALCVMAVSLTLSDRYSPSWQLTFALSAPGRRISSPDFHHGVSGDGGIGGHG